MTIFIFHILVEEGHTTSAELYCIVLFCIVEEGHTTSTEDETDNNERELQLSDAIRLAVEENLTTETNGVEENLSTETKEVVAKDAKVDAIRQAMEENLTTKTKEVEAKDVADAKHDTNTPADDYEEEDGYVTAEEDTVDASETPDATKDEVDNEAKKEREEARKIEVTEEDNVEASETSDGAKIEVNKESKKEGEETKKIEESENVETSSDESWKTAKSSKSEAQQIDEMDANPEDVQPSNEYVDEKANDSDEFSDVDDAANEEDSNIKQMREIRDNMDKGNEIVNHN